VGLIEALARTGLRVAGMKPVASGARCTRRGLRNGDAVALLAASGLALEYSQVNPYCFEPPIAPHLAAAEAGVPLRIETITRAAEALQRHAERIVVEGVGGWKVPLGTDFDLARLAATLDLPVILVVGLRLGCISQARLTAAAIHADGCRLFGWIGNTVDAGMARYGENLATLRALLPAPCLGVIPRLDDPRNAVDYIDIGKLAHE